MLIALGLIALGLSMIACTSISAALDRSAARHVYKPSAGYRQPRRFHNRPGED